MLAPAAGRVLKVPVTEGSVMMAGESVATIAANEYLLRLELPERHARFMKKGDPVRIGARGLVARPAGRRAKGASSRSIPSCRAAASLPMPKWRRSATTSSASARWSGSRPASAGRSSFPRISCSSASASTTCGWRASSGATVDVVVQTGRPAPLRAKGAEGIEILAGLADRAMCWCAGGDAMSRHHRTQPSRGTTPARSACRAGSRAPSSPRR